MALRSLIPILVAAAGLGLFACAGSGYFKHGVFYGKEAAYKLTPLDERGWQRIGISDNDLAWEGKGGELIAVNATCSGHGDPSLQVLTNHLLIGFEDRVVRQRETLEIAGRAALRTQVEASIDGVGRELELLVLKRDGCVYDMSYVAPPSSFQASLPVFRSLVESFEAMGRGR